MKQIKIMSTIENVNTNPIKVFFNSLLALITIDKLKKNCVNVLSLKGVIAASNGGFAKNNISFDSLTTNIEKAFKGPNIKAVFLNIDSPGGSPVQSALITDKIIKLSKKKNIPVYSFIDDIAASGGYWLACAGKEIYANQNSIIGSIGVISAGFGFNEAIKKLGIERRVYTQGKNKSLLDPFQAEDKKSITVIKDIQKDIHNNFIQYVKNRRLGKLINDDDKLFNGEIWSAQTAVNHGLIDGIANLENFAEEKFGEKVKINYITSKTSFVKKLLGGSSAELAYSFTNGAIKAFEEKSIYNKFGK